MGFVDEMAKHRFGHLEISNDTVFHRADRLDVAGRSTEHLFGLSADRQNLFQAACISADSHDRRFVGDDAASFDIDQNIGSS